MTTRIVILLGFVGCMPSVTPSDTVNGEFDTGRSDTATPSDTGGPAGSYAEVLLATIASDYSLGAVATVDLETGAVNDALATTSGDAVIRSTGGLAVVLNRFNTDSVRVYSGDDWSQPELEFALADLSNPQDALLCDDTLWVTQHNASRITGHDPTTGLVIASIDLSPWAGSDGAAEASSMLRDGDTVLAAVQQFDQDAGWTSEGGTLIRFPCEGGTPTVVTEIGPSPAFATGSTGRDIVINTGLYGATDGVIATVDGQTGAQQALFSEAELGRDITGVAVSADAVVFLSTTTDWLYQIHCIDRASGVRTDGPETAAFWSDIGIDDRGRAWVTARAGWAPDSPTQGGLQVFDTQSCRDISPGGAPIRTALNPYNLAFR